MFGNPERPSKEELRRKLEELAKKYEELRKELEKEAKIPPIHEEEKVEEEIVFKCEDPDELIFPDPDITLTLPQVILLGGVQVFSVEDVDPKNPLIATYEVPISRPLDIYFRQYDENYIKELLEIGFEIVAKDLTSYYIRPTKKALGKFVFVRATNGRVVGALFWKKIPCRTYETILKQRKLLKEEIEAYRAKKRYERRKAEIEAQKLFEKLIEKEIEEKLSTLKIEVKPTPTPAYPPPKEFAKEVGKIIAEEIVRVLREELRKVVKPVEIELKEVKEEILDLLKRRGRVMFESEIVWSLAGKGYNKSQILKALNELVAEGKIKKVDKAYRLL